MLNKTILMGRLTKDPELKTTQTGNAVCSFTIAVDRDRKDANGNRHTDFINCVAWLKKAEFITKYFVKGQMMVVVGSIQTRSYEDRNGNNRTATEIVVDEVSFAGERRENRDEEKPQYRPGALTDIEPDEDDGDLPF